MTYLHIKTQYWAAIACVFWLQSAQGASFITAAIASVRVDADGKGIIEFMQPAVGATPSCVAAGFNSMMAFNANSVGGKAILLVALAAKATGSQVTAPGTGACTHYPNTIEDVAYLLQR